MIFEAKVSWWPEMKQDIKAKVKDCTACLVFDNILKYQTPKKNITENWKKYLIKNTNRNYWKTKLKTLHGEVQILVEVYKLSKWPTVIIFKTSETKDVINFLSSNIVGTEYPNKKSDKGDNSFPKSTRMFVKAETLI